MYVLNRVLRRADELKGIAPVLLLIPCRRVARTGPARVHSGTRDGSEVVQIYVKDPDGLGVVPYWRRLVGFGKVFVRAGTTATATVGVRWLHLAQYDADMMLRVFPGEYTIFIGDRSDVTPLTFLITL